MLKSRFRTLAVFVLLIAGISVSPAAAANNAAVAVLQTAEGKEVGKVTFTVSEKGRVQLNVEAHDLTPGFHGFHIHAVGTCDPKTERPFTSAGGHLVLGTEKQSHGHHHGDLPSLLVMEDGTTQAMFLTDRFSVEGLLDADGSAVIVHAGADNYGNIPADRYDPDPDETTLNTGDAGGRAACGVVTVSG